MRAYVYERNPDGSDKLPGLTITNEYKTLDGLKRHALRFFRDKDINVYVYYDWNTRYGDPDHTFSVLRGLDK